MTKNKVIVLLMVFVLMISMLAGCSSAPAEEPAPEEPAAEEPAVEEPAAEAKYEDGLYYAQEDEFSANSGWKGAVILEVKEGMIDSVYWTAISNKGGVDKKVASKAGNYPMVAVGGAQSEWHEQAAAVEAYLLETQDPMAIEYADEEGHTDAIAGVSVHVNDFFGLVEKAIAAGPQAPGAYTDGGYYAEEPEFSHGWKGTVNITVLFGNIVAVDWNALPEEGDMDKDAASAEGLYGMVANGGAQSEWHEQAMLAEAYLIQTQDPAAIEYIDEDGHTDAISGVSIHVNDFYALVEEALMNAK